MFTDISDLGFELPELDIVGCFDAQDGATENQEFRHNADGGAGNLPAAG